MCSCPGVQSRLDEVKILKAQKAQMYVELQANIQKLESVRAAAGATEAKVGRACIFTVPTHHATAQHSMPSSIAHACSV
jgi:hypothetical protein